MIEREALKLALDAFGEIAWSNETQWQRDRAKEAITVIKEALAQTEQEPVKFEAVWDSGPTNKDYEDAMRLKRLQQLTAPPQRTWIGLTDEDDIDWDETKNLKQLVEAVEAKLKEKNGL